MYCKYCGKQIPDEAAFCPQCGKRTSDDGAAARPSSVAEHPKKHRGINWLVAIIILVAAVAGAFAAWKLGTPYIKYRQAEQLLKAGSYSAAAEAFEDLGQYKDSANRRLESLRAAIPQKVIACGFYHTVGIKSNGTVIADGDNEFGQCDVSNWTNIVAVAAGSYHTVGLRSDGSVVAAGNNEYGQCEVGNWTNIVAVDAGFAQTVGLRSDGTVVAVGDNEYGQSEVGNWTDIVAVGAGSGHTVGLRSDGTVVAVGDDEYGQCEVSNWTNIVAVGAGPGYTVGLRSDGTVVAVGDDEYGSGDITGEVTGLTDIKGIACAYDFTLCLRSDGTVLFPTWEEELEETEKELGISSEWRTDVIAVYAGYHIVSLRSDGTIATFCRDDICNVRGWTDIRMPVSLPNGEDNTALSQRTPQPEENISGQDVAEQATETSTETENDEYSMGVEEYDLLNAYYTGDYDDYEEIESSLYDLLDRMYTGLGENNDLVRLANCVEQAIYDGNIPLVLDALSILKSNFADKTADEYEGLPYVEGNVIELTRYDEYNTAMVVDLDTGYYGLYDRNTSAFLYYPDESCYECGADMISIEKDGYYGCVYYSGESAIGCYYEEPLRFNQNGLSAVKSNGMYGAIDKTGQKILPTQYTEVDFVGDSYLIANIESTPSDDYPEYHEFAIFDSSGNQLTNHIYAAFQEGEGNWLFAQYNRDAKPNNSDNKAWYDLYDYDGNRLIGPGTNLPEVYGVSLPGQYGMMVGICDGELTNQYGETYPRGGYYLVDYGYKYITPDLTYLNDGVYAGWYYTDFNKNGYAVASMDRSRSNDDLRVVIDLNGNEILKLSENYGDHYMIVDANDYVCVMNYAAATIDPRDCAVYIIETRAMYTYADARLIEGTNMVIVQDPSTELYGLYDGPELALNLEYTSIYYDYGRECVVATRGAESEDYYSSYTDLRVNAFLNHKDSADDVSTASSDLIINYENLNAHSEPNTSSEILGEFTTGTIMEYASHNDGWYEVSYNGQTCYVSGNYVISTTRERINNGSVGLLTTTTNVEIMAGPGTRFVVSGREDAGYDMVYDGTVDNYYRVIYDNDYAYVPDYAVRVIDSSNNQTEESTNTPNNATIYVVTYESGTVTSTGNGVRIRTEPGTDFSIIGAVNSGDKLTVTGKSGDWYRVTYNGQNGFISAAYVTKD